MIDAPHFTPSEARQTAVIRMRIPRAEIQMVMGPAIRELMATLAAQGIQPTGALFSLHHRMDPKVFDFEVGVPVAKQVSPSGRVLQGQLPACTVARTIYHGAYEGLGAGWGELGDWIQSHGYTAGTNLWECYVAGPESSLDPSQWRTELNRPLVGGA